MATTEVELVDEAGLAVGRSSVEQAHSSPGRLHRAFSVVLFNSSDEVLLQRRSLAKSRFAGLWGNTCCGHPRPGMHVAREARTRVREELGLSVTRFTHMDTFTYRAEDEKAANVVEYEYDHVLVGRHNDTLAIPDPLEVMDIAWFKLADALDLAKADSAEVAPWLRQVLEIASRYLVGK